MRTLLKGAGLAALLCLPAMAQDVPHIRVTQGELAGFKDRGADAYLNIPFAAPPTGNARWKAATAPLAWQGVRDATKYGPACMQQEARPSGPWSIEYFIAGPYSEDCLTLNVWTGPGKKKAVALFIPGGGFNQGGGGVPIYNGAEVSKTGIVFVTMNYRQSMAGFVAHPELAAESPDHASGNYTLTDIIAALAWLKANAASFGGDPDKITVMGQSAGAAAIVALLHAPQAKGLFRGAIIDSGVRANASLVANADSEKTSAGWAASKGATTLAQMRALPSEALVPVRGAPFRFGPSLDGHIVADWNTPMLDVPVLTGWNAGEGAAFNGKTLLSPVSRTELEATAATPDGKALLALYPSGDDASAAAHASGHDGLMMSGAAWIAARQAKSPTYYYDFEHVMPGAEAGPYGSYHSSELPYALDTLHTLKRPWAEADYRVSAILQAYWVNFIKTGNPNGGALPRWTGFDPARNEVMALGVSPHMRPITDPAKAAALLRLTSR